MRRIFAAFILICTSLSLSADELAEFGVRSGAKDSKEVRFEKALAERISLQLQEFVNVDHFKVYVDVTLGPEKQRKIASSKHIQLGMLGTVINLKPPRQEARGSNFIDRIESLKIQIYADSGMSEDNKNHLIELAKQEVNFLSADLIKAEVKPLHVSRKISWTFLKDFQIVIAAAFIALAIFFGFRHMTEKLQAPLQQMSEIAGLLPSQSSQVELIPAPSDYDLVQKVSLGRSLDEDHFFKLPLSVQQSVIAFTSFSVIQEVYTLLSPKYKKLFWSCLPQEYQLLPEGELIKQACAITDVENSPAWEALSQEVHNYIRRNPDLVATLHPEIRHYFPGVGEQGNEEAS